MIKFALCFAFGLWAPRRCSPGRFAIAYRGMYVIPPSSTSL
jgi:hypothetical protein